MLPRPSIVLLALALCAADATAQSFPRRDRGGSPRDKSETRDARNATTAAAAEAWAALEHELPSLKVDLLLKATQVDSWSAFERDVRDLAELERVRRRHLLSLRDAGERPATALTVIGTLVEDDRQKAEAALDLKRHFDALYASLDEAQKKMIDRRVVQAQVDPLGR
jgi:hypothetical protein